MTIHQRRLAVLLAGALIHGGCSAENGSGNSSSLSGGEVAGRAEDAATAQNSAAPTGADVALNQILISSSAGQATAELADNEASRRLVQMLPVVIEMRDHLRQEKTGSLPSPLPGAPRQTGFAAGTLGLWGNEDFVIYYRAGSVPSPGIVILGRVTSDVSIFDRPGPVRVRLERAK